MNEYKKYDQMASDIITRLKNYIEANGYYENIGQSELRQFNDKIGLSELSYQEKYQIESMLNKAIDNL